MAKRRTGENVKIPFSEIPPAGDRYTLSIPPVQGKYEEFELQGPVELSCTLQKKSENKVVLYGRVQGTLLLCCDRCLSTYPYDVLADIQLIFECQAREHWKLKEVNFPVADADLVELDEPVIDLEEVARQQLYLALPFKKNCMEKCRGICPGCGKNLNDTSCTCGEQKTNNPFAALAALRKK